MTEKIQLVGSEGNDDVKENKATEEKDVLGMNGPGSGMEIVSEIINESGQFIPHHFIISSFFVTEDEQVTEEDVIQTLRECLVVYDFTKDPLSDLELKEEKRVKLIELIEVLSRNGFLVQTPRLWEAVTNLVRANAFRVLAPPAVPPSGEFDMEEDDPAFDPSWPHLQLVYEVFLRCMESSDFTVSAAKVWVEKDNFVVKMIDLFDSEDPRERDVLKSTIHRIYSKFLTLRPVIRRHINNIFYTFIYETEKHNGISELLEILGSIVNGFALPLKNEHKCFLYRALLPLHKVKSLPIYQVPLSYCVVQFVEKDQCLSEQIILNLLKYWPKNNSPKEIMFLNELEEILDILEDSHFQKIMLALCHQLAKAVSSPHFQVAERALYIFNNDYVMGLINAHGKDLIPIMFPALYKNSKSHWNKTINGLIYNAMKQFMEVNQRLFNECAENYEKNVEQEKQLQRQKDALWQELETRAKQNPAYHAVFSPPKGNRSCEDGESLLLQLGSLSVSN
uniref:Serine/threonine protein phosphatase 2A regulatory subunit n=1 Tax=Rhabditophanes sp. KR3021 TaxID=114890 RepID=A0AC35UBV9_9BILA